MSQKKLLINDIEIILQQACDILRGEMEVSKYKDLIFGLVFLKRLSDLFREKQEKIIQGLVENGNPPEVVKEQAENQNLYKDEIFIPLAARWENLCKLEINVSDQLGFAISQIGSCNLSIEEIFSSLGFIKIQPGVSDRVLRSLLLHFRKVSFRDEDIASNDILGRACTSLLSHIAEISGKQSGEYNTPVIISKLLVSILEPKEGMSIYDPVAGTSGMLIEAVKYVMETGGDLEKLKLFGQEINLNTWAIGKIILFLYGAQSENILLGDVLQEPQHIDDNKLTQFDRIIANPPFSLKWDSSKVENDLFNRFIYGIPPKKSADFAFIQHMIASLNDTGLMAIVVPPGVFFRGGKEKEIRENLVESDLIETVINLPAGHFYSTNIPTNVLIVNKHKTDNRKGKILFIDASVDFVEKTRQINTLNDKHVLAITNAYQAFKKIENYSNVVTINEIRDNDYNLSVRKYADNSAEANQLRVLKAQFSDYEMAFLSATNIAIDIKSLGPATEINNQENSLFLPKIQTMPIQIMLPKEGIKQEHYFQISLNPKKLINEYACQFFESEIGRLILRSLSNGSNIQRLSLEILKSDCLIAVPTLKTQRHVIQASQKLKKLEASIHRFTKDISLNPNGADSILDKLDGMLESLSELNEADQVIAIIRKGESKTVEFKQTLSLDVNRLKNDKKYSPIKEPGIEKASLKTIVGFINTNGGNLLIGVNDDGEITGLDEEFKMFHKGKEDNFLKHFRNLTSGKIGPDFYPYFDSNIISLHGKRIMVVTCKQSEFEPCYLNEEFYVRTNPATDKLTAKQANEYIAKHFKH